MAENCRKVIRSEPSPTSYHSRIRILANFILCLTRSSLMINNNVYTGFIWIIYRERQLEPHHRSLVLTRVDGWVHATGNLELSMIIVLILLADPSVLDGRQGSSAIPARMAVRHWLRGIFLGVEDPRVRGVEVGFIEWWVLQFPKAITGLGRDEREHVGTNVPTAEGIEIPVGLDSGDLGIVIVEVIIRCSDELLWDGISKKNGECPVLIGVVFVLVEGWTEVRRCSRTRSF